MVIGLRADGGASVRVSATIAARCATGSFAADAAVAADGTFSATGEVRQRNVSTRYELRGTLSDTPSGTVSAYFRRAAGDRTRECRAADVPWEARRSTRQPRRARRVRARRDAAAARPTSATRACAAAIVLRIAPDGRSVSRALYGVTLRCTGDARSLTVDLPRDNVAIGPDGRVSDRQIGRRRTDTVVTSYVERFAATLGGAGGEGMFSVSLTLRARASGRLIGRCRSGEVRWSASP